ncbi:MAG: hypothetical protein FWD91_06040, partial [Treponema sp.]|nr:hypothetical protein [Treponema sp.]
MHKVLFLAVVFIVSISNSSFAQPEIEIINLQWKNHLTEIEIEEAHIDDRVTIEFETKNISHGAIIDIEIWSITDNGLTDLLDTIQGEVVNGIVRLEWEIKFDETVNINSMQEIDKMDYTIIDYYFLIKYCDITVSSKHLPIFSCFDVLVLNDKTGEPIPNSEFLLLAPDGRFL